MTSGDWTPANRATYMKRTLGLLNVTGVWSMTMGIWKKVSETEVTLTPLVSPMHPDAVEICTDYAEDARRAGYTVTLLPKETFT